MAAISAVSGHTSLSHQSDTQDDYVGWNHAANGHNENSTNHSYADYESLGSPQSAPISQNGNSDDYFTLRDSRSNSRATAPPQTKRAKDGTILTYDDENSKWIHRDKLAKIESEEMQAAGIVLPKPRTQSRSRRDRSHSRRRGTMDSAEQQYAPTSRKNPDPTHVKTPDAEGVNWDIRLPKEIAEDPGEYWVSNGSGKGTRIPVAKASPAPLPSDYIDRNAPVQRKSSISLMGDEATIAYPKSRSRSSSNAHVLDEPPRLQPGKRTATDGSPKKNATSGSRKTSAPAKSTAQGRPKTRSGPGARSGSHTRPSTRSGDIPTSTRAPEGEPPWMISAYQPDPRLPPDQQLLPTVAKRLQQEKWEQEGVFGSVYDKEFRPLNQDPFPKPPEQEKPQEETEQPQDEWPLKPEARVPTPNRPGTSSYSTMPKIQDTPTMSPLGSPRPIQQPQVQTSTADKIPDPPEQPEEKEEKGGGCGCCTVM